ncbi:MAG: SusC/RagA family TonB-linked outer membrane protein, partial [Bacteroidales bacterium]|nr:SusC/RagA family TonB-linked outer membrane protein [Bacteroidales bacterium]
PNDGTEYLSYSEGTKTVNTTNYGQAILSYDRDFGKHNISLMTVGQIRHYQTGNAGSLLMSLPQRNLGLSGRATYNYDSRYFLEFNFGYNGSERFAKNERWGFFPSFGAAWLVSNEPFWKKADNFLTRTLTKLKLKGTYGLVGNDQIGSSSDRFFYMSDITMNDSNRKYSWGENYNYTQNGISINRYGNDKITWEVAKKMNLGVELGFFDELEISAEYYTEYRTNILMSRADIPSSMGLLVDVKSNIGEASGNGIDLSADWNHSFSRDFWISGRANFTYAKTRYEVYEEPDYSATPWRSHVGQPIGQTWGYVAERLFVDDREVANSPIQNFGTSAVMGGDIKYRDINGDDRISDLDRVPIGYPTSPEIIYGFGLSTGYKGLDFSFFFQGLGHESFWIDVNNTAPFIDPNTSNSVVEKNQLMKVYADDHWSENNRNVRALWPRLSATLNQNNSQTSTWFMRDGSFLRLKSVELGYRFPDHLMRKAYIKNLRLYTSGTNLLTFSKFKLWDPEMAGSGLGYPVQRVFNFGVQLTF